jgi:hypothetical protein
MVTAAADAQDKALMQQVLDAVGPLDEIAQEAVDCYMLAGEWASVGASALCQAIRNKQPLDPGLVRKITSRWIDDMGTKIAHEALLLPIPELVAA